MRYAYSLTYRDLLEAMALHRRKNLVTLSAYILFFWVVPILGAAAVIVVLVNLLSDNSSEALRSASVSLFPLILLGALMVGLRSLQMRNLWKVLVPEGDRKSRRSTIPVTLEMTDEQLISSIIGKSEGRYYWSGLVHFERNDKIALIYIRKGQFFFIPERAMNNEGWAELRSHLEKAGKA